MSLQTLFGLLVSVKLVLVCFGLLCCIVEELAFVGPTTTAPLGRRQQPSRGVDSRELA